MVHHSICVHLWFRHYYPGTAHVVLDIIVKSIFRSDVDEFADQVVCNVQSEAEIYNLVDS